MMRVKITEGIRCKMSYHLEKEMYTGQNLCTRRSIQHSKVTIFPIFDFCGIKYSKVVHSMSFLN